MKIVFFGTGEFSTTILKGLVESGKQVVAVVTQPDKVNARNNKVIFSSIKQYCLVNNIPIHQFENLNKQKSSRRIKGANMRDDNCIFCKIANGEIPSKTIYEDEKFRVILDLGPAPMRFVEQRVLASYGLE